MKWYQQKMYVFDADEIYAYWISAKTQSWHFIAIVQFNRWYSWHYALETPEYNDSKNSHLFRLTQDKSNKVIA